MSKIYNDGKKSLHDLLEMAGLNADATLLIPDLQRPYIWQPPQVVLLVDSLIRGWPFGTLLTWKVDAKDPIRELSRGFWRVIDRTGIKENNKDVVDRMHDVPFDMVLDGQQRIQSLMLAFGNDGWGFRLLNSQWSEILTNKKKRGRAGKPHWSLGSLCVDLDALAKQYAVKPLVPSLDYTKILRWVITEEATGRSKDSGGDAPIHCAQKIENRGRYVRLSRIWKQASVSNVDVFDTTNAEKILAERECSPEQCQAFTRPLAALILTIAEVKKTEITYLELSKYMDTLGTKEDYNEAIVNIFTRLNTAGRTLTREDIIFAWLKIGWNEDCTSKKNARTCIEELADNMAKLTFAISSEEIVYAVSAMWSTIFNKGKLLDNNDLMKGETIRPMAANVSENWVLIVEAATLICQKVLKRELAFGKHYNSIHSIAYLWAWCFGALRWRNTRSLNETQKDSFQKSLEEALDKGIDRWLICSQWSGVWGTASLKDYISELAKVVDALPNETSIDKVVERLDSHLHDKIRGFESDAIKYIENLEAQDRAHVTMYYTPLWIWCRLDVARWESAKILLRYAPGATTPLEVDHVVAWARWNDKIDVLRKAPPVIAHPASELAESQPGTVAGATLDFDAILPEVNQLGNCMLLEKKFNGSKSKKPMNEFLERVHEFRKETLEIEQWAKPLALTLPQIESTATSVDTLQQLFEARRKFIVDELAEFIKGNKRRIDIN